MLTPTQRGARRDPVADAPDEVLAAVGEHLASAASGGHCDRREDEDGQGDEDEEREDHGKHGTSIPSPGSPDQIDPTRTCGYCSPVSDPEGSADPRGGRRRLPWFTEVLVAVVAVALVQAFVVKPFRVPSQSMEDTLRIGDRILVTRLDHTPQRQDVVVFGHGSTWQERRLPPADSPVVRAVRWVGDLVGLGPSNTAYTVKRVIGLPGERVACCTTDGAVTVDGDPLAEPYVYEDLPFSRGTLDCTTNPRSTRCFPTIRVPEGNLLVLGDHRSQSADSVIGCRGSLTGQECARFVPESRVVGPVVVRFWPPSHLGGIPR